MHDLTTIELALLVLTALAAGTVDAIAGGGGLLTVPVLLAVGLPPHVAIATNKGQAVFGSFASLVSFGRAGAIDRKRALVTFPLGLVGSLGGASLVLVVAPTALRPVVIVLLVLAAVFVTLRRPTESGRERASGPRALVIAATIALLIGAYDGFFGPGTGTFLIVAFVALLGDSLTGAAADAKVVNFASNLAAVWLFERRGLIHWEIAFPMAIAQLAGGVVGARMAVRGGDRIVRRVVLLVVVALAAKLAWDLWSSR